MINQKVLNKLHEIFAKAYESIWMEVYSVHHAQSPERHAQLTKKWNAYLYQYDLRVVEDYSDLADIINFHNKEVIDSVVVTDPHENRLIIMGRSEAEKILIFGLPYEPVSETVRSI